MSLHVILKVEGIVPKFDKFGNPIPNTIDHLYEPFLCGMRGDNNPHITPLPWANVKCQNPTNGSPGVGWWSNSPLAKGVAFAPFDKSQKWNQILNINVGGDWPRAVGQEGVCGKNYDKVENMIFKIKNMNYYEYES